MTDVTHPTVTDRPHAPEFLGRRRELAALRSDIDRAGLDTLAGRPAPRCRVLLVAGRPGTGRSALADKFARDLAGSGAYPDGAVRACLSEPGGVPVPSGRAARELLDALGERPPAGASDDELCDLLREALDRCRAVVVLDDVRTAGQLADLIPDSRTSLVVAVARGPLTGVPDVRPCTLAGLDRPTALRLLARGAGPVRITVDPIAAESLAEACGDLPAALVLAAGWLAAHPEATVSDALHRMADDPVGDLLARHVAPPAPPAPRAGGGDAPAPDGAGDDGGEPGAGAGRARARDTADGPLRRAFGLVHSALPAPAARMLRLLSLAPAGVVDPHTAAALAGCPVPAARAALAGFASLGLLRVTPDPDRYRIPGCLEDIVGALLDTQERPAEVVLARARMLERTVRRLRAAEAIAEPPGSPARKWLSRLPGALRFETRAAAADWLAVSRAELLAAARAAVADGGLDTLARRLLAALTRALVAHRGAAGAAVDLYRLHELVIEVARRQRLPRELAAAHLNLGDIDARAGRHTAALGRYRAALEAARGERDGADRETVGRALASLGDTYAELDDWQRAADWYGRALSLAQARGDLADIARLHARVGDALERTDQFTDALRAWRAAAAAHRRLGDVPAQARALADAARVLERADRTEDAARTARDALRLAERAGDPRLQAALRLRLAECADRLGDTAAADRHRAVADTLLAGEAPALPSAPAFETQT
ncbi:tetratricopeptide repeat protein [Streptomyces sp. RFCAC02]|uniref:tetratricopeptide repeat protein n=1 Tax=Streptomyces sp. RFCAC02 TaxID=2499143 RepID=UPI001F10E5A6|nr:tetratricopeptide repeat protein [Streptomyces sp. RFCAC02]